MWEIEGWKGLRLKRLEHVRDECRSWSESRDLSFLTLRVHATPAASKPLSLILLTPEHILHSWVSLVVTIEFPKPIAFLHWPSMHLCLHLYILCPFIIWSKMWYLSRLGSYYSRIYYWSVCWEIMFGLRESATGQEGRYRRRYEEKQTPWSRVYTYFS